MATSKLRSSPRADSKTPAKAAVVGLRPLKERHKRSEVMIKEQMLFVRQTQAAMQHVLQGLHSSCSEEDHQRNKEELQQALKSSQELVLMVQVLMKIRNELAHARLDLERAVKTERGVDTAKRRVKWLQDRLEKFLLATRSYSNLHTPPVTGSQIHNDKEQISEQLWNKLSSGQKERLVRSRDTSCTAVPLNEDVTSIVDDVAKMVPNHLSLGAHTTRYHPDEQQVAPLIDVDTTININEHSETLTHSEDQPQQHRRKHKRKKRAEVNRLLQGLSSQSMLGASGDSVCSGSESDTTVEPRSETEYFDERLSVSVASTNHDQEEAGQEINNCGGEDAMDMLRSPTLNDISTPTQFASMAEISAEHKTYESRTPAQETTQQKEDGCNREENESGGTEERLDAAQQYWQSEHHKFLWSDMQSLDPRSWHTLGLCVAETFLPKEKPNFVPELPWREKPMQVTSVIDVHKIALDRLLVRLHRMYEAVSQATQATVDPVPRDERTETVMANIELVDATSPGNERATPGGQERGVTPKGAIDTSLPPIRNTSNQQRSTSLTENVSPQIDTGRAKSPDKKSGKVFPRESTVWCQDFESGRQMPRIVKTKPKIPKRSSNVLPRYLPQKIASPTQSSLLERDTGDSIWKPFLVMKIVSTVKKFKCDSVERETSGILDHDGPKWKRIQTLLCEDGLLNGNACIAAEAAKCLGELNCRDDLIIDGLRDSIKRNADARLIYEASKAMILLGTWDPFAMKVVVQNIKRGNEDVVAELLHTMTKARNVAFVDKTTPEFQKLVSTLTQLVQTNYDRLAFDASVALGRLCVVQPSARQYLVTKLPSMTPSEKAEATYVLIKQMNCKDEVVLDCLLEQLSTANNWKHRMEAADLFIFLGARDVFRTKNPEAVFEILERLLWDHSNKELRRKVSEVLTSLGQRQRACQLVLRRLEDPAEGVRGRAVISLATLGMKGAKEMKALLDLLDLDSSVYVRIQVVRAFSRLEWNDPRIIRSLRERGKGDGTLAKEARKALYKILEVER